MALVLWCINMTTLSDRVQGRIADLDAQLQRVKDIAREQMASINKQKQVLQSILPLLTPENEAAVVALQNLGLLEIK